MEGKRPAASSSALSEKKLRRLEKNRESARECRRRKKEAAQNLQRQINRYESENLQLRLQLKIGTEAERQDELDQQKVADGLEEMLRSGASEGEIWASIEDFKEKYADYGKDRRSAIKFHLDKICHLLKPTTTTTVAMKAIHSQMPTDSTTTTTITTETTEDDSSNLLPPNNKAKTKSLFSLLGAYLEVDSTQNQQLSDSRNIAKELDETYVSSIRLVTELQKRLEKDGADLDQQFMEVAHILNPSQLAKFVIWCTNNTAAMHMLNALWTKTMADDGEKGESTTTSMSKEE
ncbi:hypothetical protein TrLO_g11880 [Triparma laevis f. longispina]|uniref:BZIP domain-containing protein n=1 Tax=Triparma laevis f. longispina TaxID=1714387 RepID=A0A9W7FVR5_9STRA|nr:hypothetical protein TrLO_g11880 [Triparma laevis f. longispina]